VPALLGADPGGWNAGFGTFADGRDLEARLARLESRLDRLDGEIRGRLQPAVVREPAGSIPLAEAARVFARAREISDAAHAATWGRPILGPILLADRSTRDVVASEPSADGALAASEGVWVGRLPDAVNAANTAVDVFGKKWTMLLWPVPLAEDDQSCLLAHELFHRIQADLGLPAANSVCAHLDGLEGRYWLKLEWRALAAALEREGDERRAAVTDALVFRARRRALSPGAAEAERALEMNEGLAEYTGVRLGWAAPDRARRLAARMRSRAESLPTFARSFAYESGPAYGLLLDALDAKWRTPLKPTDDLGDRLARAAGVSLPADVAGAAAASAERYDGRALRTAEEARERSRLATLDRWRASLVDRPVLVLPLGKEMRYGFDPYEVVSLEGVGTVYPTGRLSDEWGQLEVESGMLLEDGFARAHVKAPKKVDGTDVAGDGWTLHLAPGWRVVPGARAGDWTLRR
jgi:hypothetical protein